jgi:hypothetical protein
MPPLVDGGVEIKAVQRSGLSALAAFHRVTHDALLVTLTGLMVMTERGPRFAVCIRNEGYEAPFEPHKIYRIVSDLDADKRVRSALSNESGEDYLYPSDWVVSIEAPEVVE